MDFYSNIFYSSTIKRMPIMQSTLPQKCVVLALAGLALVGCQPLSTPEPDSSARSKITFDLDQFDEYGLYGPTDGKRSLDYEFCIPQGEHYASEVQRIDPSVNFFPTSAGRIGCTENQILTIGNTHQDDFRLVLLELANLDYVDRIQRVDWE
jgi:hypothetical protein